MKIFSCFAHVRWSSKVAEMKDMVGPELEKNKKKTPRDFSRARNLGAFNFPFKSLVFTTGFRPKSKGRQVARARGKNPDEIF